ncbi:MAG TPA: glycosyltransferase family A protein [Levilinea sp.]|nr:glycosyltransferase family A protein [Levilinea sp.]
MTLLTFFTAPKPMTNPHIATIQRNAIQSWIALGAEVEVLVIGEEDGLAEVCAELRVKHLPEVARNTSGTPLVSSIFDLARRHGKGKYLAYVNADIILLPDVLATTRQITEQARDFLVVGQRWDLDVHHMLAFDPGWEVRLMERARSEGKLHPRGGSDYFVYPRHCFQQVPDFAIGRAGWDNWMFYEARRRGWLLVDGSHDIQIIHQNHDYSHLPHGQPHYRLPETAENVRMAGGRRTIFSLLDCNKQSVNGKLRAADLSWAKFWREVEIFPLVRLHSMALAQLAFALIHPSKAWIEFRRKK